MAIYRSGGYVKNSVLTWRAAKWLSPHQYYKSVLKKKRVWNRLVLLTTHPIRLFQSQPFEWLLTKRHETEDIFGVQLLGNNPFAMTRCAQLLEEKTNIDFIDVSVGSPGDMVSFKFDLSRLSWNSMRDSLNNVSVFSVDGKA